jgi:hypothetical protein
MVEFFFFGCKGCLLFKRGIWSSYLGHPTLLIREDVQGVRIAVPHLLS